MDRISVDFEAAKREASQLENMASELERLAQGDCQQILQELSQSWKGESADAYRRKAETLRQQLLQTVRDMNTTAGNIRNSAQRIYNAEMYAKQLAEKRH